MKCLVLGASGQLGRALCAQLRKRHDVVEAANRRAQPGQWRIDLTDPAAVAAALGEIEPEWILISGAYCNVDGAEAARPLCFAVNVDGPRAVVAYAQAAGCGVVYFSTDSVFDGSQPSNAEDDEPRPLNVYSESKVRGEAAVRRLPAGRHLIIRTASLYGPDEGRRNFVYRLIDEARAGRRVPVPADQEGTPTYVDDLAHATMALLEGGHRGTFHAAGPELIDRVSLARRVCARFGLDPGLIEPVQTRDLGQVARRPLRTRLDCAKLRAAGIGPFRGVDDGLKTLHDAMMAFADA
jgi:dTDP-4-dehydrorhamnose reductase